MDDAANLPPWERFRKWIHCICVVTFDLEFGQSIEVLYPGDAQLSATEKMNICYLAFPDSNSGCSRDTRFVFRIRRSAASLNDAQIAYSESVPPTAEIDRVHQYGFVHFRQQKDQTLPRGYFQKSLVVISPIPLFNLFSLVTETIARSFFESDEPAIEAACHDVDQWPPPNPGEKLCLPLLGYVIHCRIPYQADQPFVSKRRTDEAKSEFRESIVLPSMNEINIYDNLRFMLNYIHLLWELVLLGEPLIVMASNPTLCSSVVLALISLISPLKYFNDYRPFFTIHDSEFREYTSRVQNHAKVILGVTNPFFSKILQNWPHIIKVGDDCKKAPSGEDQLIRKAWDGRTLDSKPGLYTQYKTFLNRDKSMVKNILKSHNRADVPNVILKRQMLELTHSFMIPLERYISSLMPLRKEMSPFKAPPQARPFVADDFISTLSETSAAVVFGIKGDWNGLYRIFLTSRNFEGWLLYRRKNVNRQLRSAHLEMLCSTNFSSDALKSCHQVEIVDLVLKICDRLRELKETRIETRNRLKEQLTTIMQSADDDLKSVLLSNSEFRDLIE